MVIKKKDYFVIFLITVIFCLPILFTINYGSDTIFHMYRLQGIKEALQAHTFPIYIYPFHNFGFGYASPLFYCDLFLLIPGLLYTLGLPIVYCVKIVYIFFAIVGNILMYYALKYIYKDNDYVVYIGLLLFCFSGPRIVNAFNHGGISFYIAYSFIPLVYLAVYKVIVEHEDSWLLLGLSFVMILLSHLQTFAICCLCFLLIIIINLKTVVKSKTYKTIIKGVVLGLALSAFFLFPLLEQKFSQKFWLDFALPIDGTHFLLHYRYSFIEIVKSLFSYSNISYGIIPLLLMVMFYIRNRFFLGLKNIKFDFLLIVIILSSLLVWEKVDLTHIPFMYAIQFAWRFLTVIYFMVIYLDCELINYKNNKKLTKILFILFSCISSIAYFSHVSHYNSISNDFDILTVYTNDEAASIFDNFDVIRIGRAEYLPYTNFYDYYHSTKEIIFANEEPYLYDYNRVGTTISFSTNLNYDENINMPLSWYKGYYCKEVDENNNMLNEVEGFPNEYNKRVGIRVAGGGHNYIVYYKGTFIQKVSLLISFISLIFILKKRKKF